MGEGEGGKEVAEVVVLRLDGRESGTDAFELARELFDGVEPVGSGSVADEGAPGTKHEGGEGLETVKV